jgi:dihydroorotase-like cyclic amidohydrolase
MSPAQAAGVAMPMLSTLTAIRIASPVATIQVQQATQSKSHIDVQLWISLARLFA